jgi:putative RNA 2'-phosphotransferase
MNTSTHKSKFLALILRHDPACISISMDKHGWVSVSDLCRLMPITKDELDTIVRTDAKGRYAYSPDHRRIRANQGHSIDVDVELEEVEPPEFLWHGTAKQFVGLIFAGGIKSMDRQYVHMSGDKQTALSVGKRHGLPVVLKIRAKELFQSGEKFWISQNGVWLAKSIPTGWFSTER